MQPLISPIEHESRHGSQRVENEEREMPAEDTPLLNRFPQVTHMERNPVTTAVVSLLLIILIAGVIIGIYLLILQNNSENILPPVSNSPLRIVNRSQWSPGERATSSLQHFTASYLIVVQTDTKRCDTIDSCSAMLRTLQKKRREPLPYNFLLSSSGHIYEGLGWHLPSNMFPEYNRKAVVLAYIGNYTKTPLSGVQKQQTKTFIAMALSEQHLDPSFIVFGKKTKEVPKLLFHSLETLPQWSTELSDT
ncbi:peptidoglycan-recognition protein SB1-like isoform X2 [Achroia grisella]|uniref:peptidoglycan-recognition protein SB1-like isoform X2 n=1 Tax=Achroia grisella TaxID=688607 RepID=UPI0027D30C6B|nr:peptidoglycan-recognition protein SB1-like isoform X2 [Achroia grisella]